MQCGKLGRQTTSARTCICFGRTDAESTQSTHPVISHAYLLACSLVCIELLSCCQNYQIHPVKNFGESKVSSKSERHRSVAASPWRAGSPRRGVYLGVICGSSSFARPAEVLMQNMSVNCKDYHAASRTHPPDRRSASAQIAAASYDQWARMTRS